MKDGYEVVAVNCWSEVNKNMKDTLSVFWKTLLLIHNTQEFNEIVRFLKNFSNDKKIVYISLTKTNEVIVPYFNKIKSRIFVVDCASTMLFEKKNTESCFFEDPPSNLNEMIKLLDKYIDKLNPDLIIIDSISHFIDFSSVSPSESKKLLDFLNYFKDIKHSASRRFVMLFEETSRKELRCLPTYYVDLIIRLEVIIDKISWG